MKYRKTGILILLTIILASIFCGCSSTEASDTDTTEEETTEEETTAEVELTGELDLDTFAFTLNGENYTMPLTIQDIIDAGYDIDEDVLSETLEAEKYYTGITAENSSGNEIVIQAINLGDTETMVSECNVRAITIISGGVYNNTCTLDNGCEIGVTTLDDFDDAFTDPDYTYDGDTLSKRKFVCDSTSYYYSNSICFSFNDGVLTEIEILYYD